MTFGLLFPLGLTALASLLVPLAIHIARRSEQRLTDFAALRWLRERPKPRSRLRLDERLLLALRLLLLALAALWLAQPVLTGAAGQSSYIAVIPGARYEASDKDREKAHWLAPGFPAFDTPAPSLPLPTASLIRELDATLPPGTSLTIVAPSVLDGADAERPKLSRKVRWQITAETNAAPPATKAPPPPRIAIRTDTAHQPSLRYLRAAAAAWAAPGEPAPLDTGPLSSSLPSTSVTLFWMGGGSLPDTVRSWVARGGQAVIAADALWPDAVTAYPVWFDTEGDVLARKGMSGRGQMVQLSHSLSPSRMPLLLESDFPERLRDLIAPAPAPTRAAAADYAPLPGGPPPVPRRDDLRPWLAILIAALVCAERWIATRCGRGPTP